jgi:SAM-dependent methyltransferase/uncharacterized protein YoxC
MIETTIPETDVSDLMDGVRMKLNNLAAAQGRGKLPEPGPVGAIAPAVLPKPVALRVEQIRSSAQAARKAITVSRWIPKPLRHFFRRQSTFNREAIRAIEWLAQTNSQIADRLRHLSACVEVQDHGIQHLAELRRADGEWMNAMSRTQDDDGTWIQSAEKRFALLTEQRRIARRSLDAIAKNVSALEQEYAAASTALTQEFGRLREQVASLENEINVLQQRASAFDQFSQKLTGQIAAFEQMAGGLAEHVTTLAHHNEQLSIQTNNIQSEHNALSETVRALQNDLDDAGKKVQDLSAQREQLASTALERTQQVAMRNDLESLEQRYTSDAAFIKAELSRQSRLLDNLNAQEPWGQSANEPQNGSGKLPAAAGHSHDAFYLSFENRFRGPRSEIKHRVRFYLPFIEKVEAGTKSRPILDLGCGRGEWLEVLRAEKRIAMGVDFNDVMIEQCQERKLKVFQGDAIEFLHSSADKSFGAITGFHIIEHLRFDVLMNLIRESFRVLQPGGLAIFESPNCKNVSVGACHFYIDPTHHHPVFPETAQFLLENHGFEPVTLEYLCPMEATDIKDIEEIPISLRELFYGPRDFGVIGYKPIGN